MLARSSPIERRIPHFRLSRRQFQAVLAAGALSVAAGGCGSMLYPERIGQPRGGPLDWKVVALDTIGLLLFFVPGVIAFVVDFQNGTIFLPVMPPSPGGPPMQLSNAVRLDRREISLADIEQTVRDELAIELDLQPGTYVTRELESLDEYPALAQKLSRAVARGELRCQSPDVSRP